MGGRGGEGEVSVCVSVCVGREGGVGGGEGEGGGREKGRGEERRGSQTIEQRARVCQRTHCVMYQIPVVLSLWT